MSTAAEAARRRTFAIISHPDAGKTTLTEKLLLYAGAIHLAGSVKSRKASRHAVSDWMQMEQERGISITSSVLQFGYNGSALNLLDTPGHADFSDQRLGGAGRALLVGGLQPRPALNNGLVEQALSRRHGHQRADLRSAAGLAEEGDIAGIAAERLGVVAHPFQRRDEVEQAGVGASGVILAE